MSDAGRKQKPQRPQGPKPEGREAAEGRKPKREPSKAEKAPKSAKGTHSRGGGRGGSAMPAYVPRFKKRYNDDDPPGADEEVRLQEPIAGAEARTRSC